MPTITLFMPETIDRVMRFTCCSLFYIELTHHVCVRLCVCVLWAPKAKNSANTRNAEHAVIECEFITNLILLAVIAFYLVNPALGIPIQNKICPIERVQNRELTESIRNWLNSILLWGQLISFDQNWKVSCSFSKAVRTNIVLAFKLPPKSKYIKISWEQSVWATLWLVPFNDSNRKKNDFLNFHVIQHVLWIDLQP